ncbi:MAG: Gldg family protein, partial [Clostridia bacterium]|nr:Gldg family protein [Clostridia bacterium]
MKRKSVLTKKKLKYGSAAVIFTVLFIAVVILFNGVFSALASRYGWYADMTQEAVFTLSERAREYVADVGADIDIIFAEEPDLLMADEDMRYVYTTAKQLEEAVDGVTVRCVNVVKDPAFFKEFYSTSATDITTRSVVVRSGTESKVLTPQSFFVYNEEYVRWGYQGEYRFVSAIMQVTQSETPVVCFTTRHGEKDFEKS